MTTVAPKPPFGHDLCLSFFGECYDHGMFRFPPNARVLEVGCAEADWSAPMKQLRPDLHITSIDVRSADRPASDVLIQGDVRERGRFLPDSFDCIVAVSTIEHIGLGAYGDPVDDDGDTTTMANLHDWVSPTGWLYFDVPYRETYTVTRNWRGYDDAQLQARLLTSLWRETARMVIDAKHPDAPYIALTVRPRGA
jgi:hypothetical protein